MNVPFEQKKRNFVIESSFQSVRGGREGIPRKWILAPLSAWRPGTFFWQKKPKGNTFFVTRQIWDSRRRRGRRRRCCKTSHPLGSAGVGISGTRSCSSKLVCWNDTDEVWGSLSLTVHVCAWRTDGIKFWQWGRDGILLGTVNLSLDFRMINRWTNIVWWSLLRNN